MNKFTPRFAGSCLVLLAHGSRRPGWRAPFEEMLADLRREAGADAVCLAYMQLAKPGLGAVVRDLTEHGVRAIRILPLLISTGSHADGDIPAEVAKLRQKHPDVAMEILPPIGSHPRFKAFLRELVKESLCPAEGGCAL
ncbi:MAG: CbiX/SirB N-terminal domain-containing protein [Lentisphaerae bacterium]|nr:CbiX/SirB N-terminal domain-containing protein [Lentisphaerota bacterium]